jgi:hypothetical protein
MREAGREHIVGSVWDPADRDGWIGPMDRKGLHMVTTLLRPTIPVEATGAGAPVASRWCLPQRTHEGELRLPAVGPLRALLIRGGEEECGGRPRGGSCRAVSRETSSARGATINP